MPNLLCVLFQCSSMTIVGLDRYALLVLKLVATFFLLALQHGH